MLNKSFMSWGTVVGILLVFQGEVSLAAECSKKIDEKELCSAIEQKTKDETDSYYNYVYDRLIEEAACVTEDDKKVEIAKKVNSAWNMQIKSISCRGGLNILKIAVEEKFNVFIEDATKTWKVDLNHIDEVDGKTVLDFVQDALTKDINTDNEKTLRKYYEMIRFAGGVHTKIKSPISGEFDILKDIEAGSPYSGIILRSFPLSEQDIQRIGERPITMTHYEELSLLINTLDLSSLEASNNKLIFSILKKNGLTSLIEILEGHFLKKDLKSPHSETISDLYARLDQISSLKFRLILKDALTRAPRHRLNEKNSALISDYHLETNKKLVNDLRNTDMILPHTYLEHQPLLQPVVEGQYSLSTKCGTEKMNINKTTEVTTGTKVSCDPGDYSKGASSEFLPFFKTTNKESTTQFPFKDKDAEHLETKVAYEMAATGGYACENFGGYPRNCRDYTSRVQGTLTGSFKIGKCTDIYSCGMIYGFYVGSTTTLADVNWTIDGKKMSDGLFLRDEEHEINFLIKDNVAHTGGSGARKSAKGFRFDLKRLEGTLESRSVHSSEHPYCNFDSLKNLAEAALQEPSYINRLIDRIRKARFNLLETELKADYELCHIYSYLKIFNQMTGKDMDVRAAKVFRIVQQNISNRARELRENSLSKSLKEQIDRYQNRFGSKNLYLNILEKLILDEEMFEQKFHEYEQIVNQLIQNETGQKNLSFATKKTLLKALYQAELIEKQELYNSIKQDVSELSQYKEVPSTYHQFLKEIH